jgi:hypothetical protein
MVINFADLADALYALATLTGLAMLVAIGAVTAAALTGRGKTRHAGHGAPAAAVPAGAHHPTRLDRPRELV